jgi:hypothetical protein
MHQHVKSLATEIIQLRDLKPGDRVLWDDNKVHEVAHINGQMGLYFVTFKDGLSDGKTPDRSEMVYEPKLCRRVRK